MLSRCFISATLGATTAILATRHVPFIWKTITHQTYQKLTLMFGRATHVNGIHAVLRRILLLMEMGPSEKTAFMSVAALSQFTIADLRRQRKIPREQHGVLV